MSSAAAGSDQPAVPSGLRRRLHTLSFVDEFGPVYAVYTLWFSDNGISTSQVSTIFLVWAVVALVLEVPSGALADRVDRRHLLAVAFLLRATGLTIWLVWPTMAGALLGTVLWATHDAFASGSWEAMIHDELEAVGAERRYGPVMARVNQFSNLGVAAGTLLGAALLRVDVGLATLGWITVAAHAGSVSLVLTLPDVGWVAKRDGDDDVAQSSLSAWWSTLRAGVAEARHVPVIGRLVAVGALLEGLFLLDEYIPLLSRARGGADSAAPVIVFIVWIGLLLGDEVAARRPHISGRVLGSALVVSMGVTAFAFLLDAVWALALVAIGYAVLETVWISTDARLQERTSGATRATVTSVRGFGSAWVSMIMFAIIAAMADGDDPTPGLFVMVAALGVGGVLIMRWLPPPITGQRAEPDQAAPAR